MLVRELTAAVGELGPAELAVVGDADQSIYAFRGATIRNILEFERDYPDATTILLEQNYRSTQNILTAANAVISRNEDRKPKNLWSQAGAGEKILGYVAENEHDEAAWVAQQVQGLTDDDGLRASDIAIFYRANAQSRVFEEVFIRIGLPYKVVGGVRFYERREIRDALAYLRAIANPADVVSLRRILNTPRRGIGDRAEASIEVLAEREEISFPDALDRATEAPGLATRSLKAIIDFQTLMTSLRAVEGGPGEILEAVLDQTGYLRELEKSTDPQDEGRVDNLQELINVAREFEEARADLDDRSEAGLSAFLEQVAMVADADSIPDSGGGLVTLMTLHTAKGLEFPAVFLTGMEEGVFPHSRALSDPARAGRGTPPRLRRDHPRARAAVPVARLVAHGVGSAVVEPAGSIPGRDPRRTDHLDGRSRASAVHRSLRRRRGAEWALWRPWVPVSPPRSAIGPGVAGLDPARERGAAGRGRQPGGS